MNEKRVAFQLPARTAQEIDELASKMNQTRSQMYRWICVSFMESIHDEADPPVVPAVVALARSLEMPEKSKRSFRKRETNGLPNGQVS